MNNKQKVGNIELHVKELVLYGFPSSDRHRIGEAVRQELLSQFTEQGVPHALTQETRVARLNAGSIQTGQGVNPENIGMQVAQAVYGSLADGRKSVHDKLS